MKFKIDIEGVALDAEPLRDLQRLEVRTEAAVWTSRDRDVLAVVDARIALHHPRQRLDEREVGIATAEIIHLSILIAAQHTRILLAGLHPTGAVHDGFQVYAQFCVTVPTLEIGVLYF